MTRKLSDLIEDAEENRALMVPYAIRDTGKGYVVTGYTAQKMMQTIDVYRIVGGYVDALSDRNMGRALRLVDYLRGKVMGRFPWGHRDQLRSDIAGLARCLSQGGYSTEE